MSDNGRKSAKLVFRRQNNEYEIDRDMASQFLHPRIPGQRDSAAAIALRRHFAHTTESCFAKDTAQLDETWKTGNKKKRCQLLKNRRFLKMLDEKQANDILDTLEPDLLHCLYKWIKRNPMHVLPPSPRLTLLTRVKLMLAALATHEPELGKGLEAKVRELIRTDAALSMATDEFPPENVLEDFLHCLASAKFMDSPASMLANAPADSGLSLILRHYIWNKEASLLTYQLQQRHGLWEEVILKTKEGETGLDLRDILTICNYCDLENADPDLVSSLFELGHPLVQEAIIYTGLLNQNQRDRAWQQGNVKVCRKLIGQPEFIRELTNQQAEDIIALGDTHMLQTLAHKIHYLYTAWEEIEERRLTPGMRDKLLMYLMESHDKDVQRLLDMEGIPAEIIMKIRADMEG